MAVTQTVSVMRRGEMTATVPTAETSPEQLAALMVGRKVLLRVTKKEAHPGEKVLEAKDLRVSDDRGVETLKGVTFDVRAGEILGIAGVAGNGQTELLQVLGGIADATGSLRINGKEIPLSGPGSDALSRRASGLAHVPEDRQHLGLIMDFFAWENMAFGYQGNEQYNLNKLLMDNAAIRGATKSGMERFDVRPVATENLAKSFSGGNQQKIVLAREIDSAPALLVVGQPTRGVDIGAIEFIHQRILDLRDDGTAIILVSVELEEIFSLSDRVAVMFDGRIIGERVTKETNEQDLGLLMAGVAEDGS